MCPGASSDVVLTRPIALGERELTAAERELTVEIVGANPKAIHACMFVLNQVLLEEVK